MDEYLDRYDTNELQDFYHLDLRIEDLAQTTLFVEPELISPSQDLILALHLPFACQIALFKIFHLFNLNKLFSSFADTMPCLKELAAKKTKKTAREGRKRKTLDSEDESLPLDPLPLEHEALLAEPEIPTVPKQKGVVINKLVP